MQEVIKQSRQQRADGTASRAKLVSVHGKDGVPVGRQQQLAVLSATPAIHHRAGYAARKEARQDKIRQYRESLPTEKRFLWDCVNVLSDAFEVSGFTRPDAVLEDKRQRKYVERLSVLSTACGTGLAGCFKLMKYKLAAFFSALMQCDMPLAPFPDPKQDNPLQVVPGRAARRFVAALKRDAEDPLNIPAFQRKLTLAVNVLQAKKGFPRPNKQMLDEAALKTFQELTAPAKWVPPPKVPWGDISDEREFPPLEIDWHEITVEVNRAVDELFQQGEFTNEDRVEPFFPSTNANYTSSRSNAGAVGALFNEEHQTILPLKGTESGIAFDVDDAEERRGDLPVTYDASALRLTAGAFYHRVVHSALAEAAFAQPVSLAEALKVRVITKGPALMATAMKPLQRFLWRKLSQHRCFQLTGRPVDNRVLLHVLGRKLGPGQQFLSGDYANATNMLNSRISNTICWALARRLDLSEEETELFERSLTGHTIVHDGKEMKQLNGQLMGSVTSFPVLCIANFVVCRLALEMEAGRRLQTSTLPLLINGDDCAFRCTIVGREWWERISAFVGLEPSLGKVYFSRRFVNINSTNFAFADSAPELQKWKRENVGVRKHPLLPVGKPVKKINMVGACPAPPVGSEPSFERENPYLETKFVNFGLLAGLKRSGGLIGIGDFCDPIDGIGPRHRELLRSCPPDAKELVNRVFFRNHAENLRRVPLPWFLPEWMAGLGCVGDQNEEYLKLARGALLNWSKWRSRPAVAAAAGSPWRVRQYCRDKYLRDLPQVRLTDAESQEEGRVLGLLSAATMFDSRVRLDDIFRESDGMTALKANQKFWKEVRRANCFVALPDAQDIDGLPLGPEARCRAFQRELWDMSPPKVGVKFAARSTDVTYVFSPEIAHAERRLLIAQRNELTAEVRVAVAKAQHTKEMEAAFAAVEPPPAPASAPLADQRQRGTRPPLRRTVQAALPESLHAEMLKSPERKATTVSTAWDDDGSEDVTQSMSRSEVMDRLATEKIGDWQERNKFLRPWTDAAADVADIREEIGEQKRLLLHVDEQLRHHVYSFRTIHQARVYYHHETGVQIVDKKLTRVTGFRAAQAFLVAAETRALSRYAELMRRLRAL